MDTKLRERAMTFTDFTENISPFLLSQFAHSSLSWGKGAPGGGGSWGRVTFNFVI